MNNYRDRLNAIMQTQELKGLNKYGALLENGTVSLAESVDHALEEILDLAYYLMHVKTLLEAEQAKVESKNKHYKEWEVETIKRLAHAKKDYSLARLARLIAKEINRSEKGVYGKLERMSADGELWG
jgi:hypothetical protein